MNLGWTDGLLNLVDALLSRIESFLKVVRGEGCGIIDTESMLLKAELVFQSKDAEEWLRYLRLREAYPERRLTERSFLVEADFGLQAGNLNAQETLAALAVQNPRVVWLRRLFWRRL